MNRDNLIERIQKHGLANLVEKMREAQFDNYANKKALQVKVDNAIKRIKEYDNEK